MKKVKSNPIKKCLIIKNEHKTKKYLFNNSSFNRDCKNNTISTPIIGSSSTKNSIYINKLKNQLLNKIDYSDYFKICNQKSENNIKVSNIDLNNLKTYTIQTQNTHSSKNIITSHNKFLLNHSSNNNNNSNIIKNRSIIINKNQNLYDNQNYYNRQLFKNNINNISKINKKNNIIYIKNSNNDDIKTIFHKEGDNIDNDINKNINNIKKQEEFLKLKRILINLKIQNKKLQTDLNILKNNNLTIENIKRNNNKKIYIDIKNKFNKIEKSMKNNNKINNDDLLNFYILKFGATSSLKEKIIFLNNIYLHEKLKNSLIEKTYNLLLNNNILKEEKKDDSNININNILKWIKFLIKEIDKIKKDNEKLKTNINNNNIENNLYNIYYNNWINCLGVKTEENLKKKITDLINDQNYNDIEENKLYNILMNKES